MTVFSPIRKGLRSVTRGLIRCVRPALWLVFILGATILAACMVDDDIASKVIDALGADDKHEALTFGGLALGGVLLVVQAMVADDRAKATLKQVEVMAVANVNTEIGQRQERMRSAIEHLGHNKDTIRLGAVYELYSIAKNTEDTNIRQEIVDIICSHIRVTTRTQDYPREYVTGPSEEMQSLLNVLFKDRDAVFYGQRVDLRGSFLVKANLLGARLVGASLDGVLLCNAVLARALLQGAKLMGADLSQAIMDSCNMQGSLLLGTNLTGANLTSAKLQGAFLERTDLRDAILTSSRLEGVGPVGRAHDGISLKFGERMMAQADTESNLSKVLKNGQELGVAKTGTYTKEEAQRWIEEASVFSAAG